MVHVYIVCCALFLGSLVLGAPNGGSEVTSNRFEQVFSFSHYIETDKFDELYKIFQDEILKGQTIDIAKYSPFMERGGYRFDLFGKLIADNKVAEVRKLLKNRDTYDWIFSMSGDEKPYLVIVAELNRIDIFKLFVDLVKPEDRWVLFTGTKEGKDLIDYCLELKRHDMLKYLITKKVIEIDEIENSRFFGPERKKYLTEWNKFSAKNLPKKQIKRVEYVNNKHANRPSQKLPDGNTIFGLCALSLEDNEFGTLFNRIDEKHYRLFRIKNARGKTLLEELLLKYEYEKVTLLINRNMFPLTFRINSKYNVAQMLSMTENHSLLDEENFSMEEIFVALSQKSPFLQSPLVHLISTYIAEGTETTEFIEIVFGTTDEHNFLFQKNIFGETFINFFARQLNTIEDQGGHSENTKTATELFFQGSLLHILRDMDEKMSLFVMDENVPAEDAFVVTKAWHDESGELIVDETEIIVNAFIVNKAYKALSDIPEKETSNSNKVLAKKQVSKNSKKNKKKSKNNSKVHSVAVKDEPLNESEVDMPAPSDENEALNESPVDLEVPSDENEAVHEPPVDKAVPSNDNEYEHDSPVDASSEREAKVSSQSDEKETAIKAAKTQEFVNEDEAEDVVVTEAATSTAIPEIRSSHEIVKNLEQIENDSVFKDHINEVLRDSLEARSIETEIKNILNGDFGIKIEELTEIDQRAASVHEADIVDYNNEVERVEQVNKKETFKNLLIDLINKNKSDEDLELDLANLLSQRSSSSLSVDSRSSTESFYPKRKLSTSSAPADMRIDYHEAVNPTKKIVPVQSGSNFLDYFVSDLVTDDILPEESRSGPGSQIEEDAVISSCDQNVSSSATESGKSRESLNSFKTSSSTRRAINHLDIEKSKLYVPFIVSKEISNLHILADEDFTENQNALFDYLNALAFLDSPIQVSFLIQPLVGILGKNIKSLKERERIIAFLNHAFLAEIFNLPECEHLNCQQRAENAVTALGVFQHFGIISEKDIRNVISALVRNPIQITDNFAQVLYYLYIRFRHLFPFSDEIARKINPILSQYALFY
ncbi:hypothetical protein ROZALSC1DRAFT_30693 [Rozella allomycis CSF55]|uniref:Uncharacterized protein n=1 Tax=Rozella allomycis (strain CSF55) TaxID=988480 RepID=A0A4P9YEB6_ROZAC|nr:hypothetical protein ROZALSC1DRAFT_30693 [Rozella allomycis CSF55]